MKYGYSLIVRGNDATPDGFARTGELAESLEVDSLWLSAHVILPPQERSGYAMVPGRKFGQHWRDGYWEPFTVMSYLAASTSRVTLGTSVVVLPMHNPIELAKQVAEVDCLTGGRFVFGIGVGWFEEEFEALGQNFRNRGRRTDEALDLMKKLWTEEPVTFEGRYYSVRDANFKPKPVQRPHPPLWVAGGPAALKRTARVGDAYHPVRVTPEELVERGRELDRLLSEAGREPGACELAVKLPLVFTDGPPGEGDFPTQGRPVDIIEGIRRYRDAGASHFVFDFVPEEMAVATDTMKRVAQEVWPKVNEG